METLYSGMEMATSVEKAEKIALNGKGERNNGIREHNVEIGTEDKRVNKK